MKYKKDKKRRDSWKRKLLDLKVQLERFMVIWGWEERDNKLLIIKKRKNPKAREVDPNQKS